jgi:ketosteroid isomerase-like protein
MGPIALYLRRVAARRAYSAAQRRDGIAYRAWVAGDRSRVNGVVACDVTQAQVTEAWRKMVNANQAFTAYVESL